MSEWFRIGQKVQCIKRGPWKYELREARLGVEHPRYGRVYTVRAIETADPSRGGEDGAVYLLFEEIRNRKGFSGFETSFNARQFRPLRKRKTSIEVFQRLLKTEKVEVKA